MTSHAHTVDGALLTDDIRLESPHAEPETADWVRQARAGDSEAFASLVRLHERMVLRTAVRILGRLDDAEDAAQEVFLRMHKYLHRFDETRELGPWLYRIVVNACHNLARPGPRVVPLDETLPASGVCVEREVETTLQRRIVQEALASLPEKERAAIVLRDIEGLPTSEVARILGSSEGTVRSQISTGRVKIKRYVEGRERRPV